MAKAKSDPNNPNPDLDQIKLYAVRNKEGKWFRSKGYGGYGDSWVVPFKKAKLYPRPAGARHVITFFNNKYPQFGTPNLVQFNVGSMEIIDESERIAKEAARKKRKIELQAQNVVKNQIAQAESDLSRAQQRLKHLQSQQKK